MKKLVLLLAVVPLVTTAGIRPMNVVAELATGTWCGYCPQAYAGLEVMKGKYPVSDFFCARYYNNSGDLSNPEADARDNYYGVTGYPTCVFNGLTKVVGGGDATANGSRYDPVVSSLLTEGSPFWLNVDMDVGGTEITVTTTITLFDNYSGTAPKLWVALTEDDIESDVTNAVRRVVSPGDVTITNEGQEQVIGETFDIEAGWNTGNMHAVVFLQIDGTKEILQASSSYPKPDYHYRVTAPSRIERIDPSGSFTSTFYVTNVGAMTDDIDITLDDSGLPSGWTAMMIMPEYMVDFNLAPDEAVEISVRIEPNGNTGQGMVTVNTSSTNGGEDQELLISAVTNDVDINVVDDDGGEEFEDYFTAALDDIGRTYGVWDINMTPFNMDNLASDKTPVLIWSCGWSFPSLTDDDQDLLEWYLDNGGKLFLTGQDIGWDLIENDESDWQDAAFYHNYLHADYINDDANNYDLAGVGGDPITDGMSFAIQGGDGADNQEYPSIIDAYDETATVILNYSTGTDGAAIRAESGDYKVVYLAFGYEAIDNAADRKDLLEKSLDWLGPALPISGIAEEPVVEPVLKTESISQGLIVVHINTPISQGRLAVFDASGRRVAVTTLIETQGFVELNVSHLPAGCYFVYLESTDISQVSKVILLD